MDEPADRAHRRPPRLTFILGVVGGVASTLLATGLIALLDGPSVGEELRDFVAGERGRGRIVVLHRRVALSGPQIVSRVVVLRDRRGRRSDEIVVLEEDGDDLTERFRFEARPGPPRLSERAGIVDGRRGVHPYRAEAIATADVAGVEGSEQLLLALRATDSLLAFPLVLWFDDLGGRYRLSPVIRDDLTIGPRPVAPIPRVRGHAGGSRVDVDHPRLAGYRLVLRLYRTKTLLTDVVDHAEAISTYGADRLALIRGGDSWFLAAGFAVEAHRGLRGAEESDVDCELDYIRRPRTRLVGCAASGAQRTGPPRATWLNMKAWRFARDGVGVDAEFCDGPRLIVRGRRDVLQRNWKRYMASGRAC